MKAGGAGMTKKKPSEKNQRIVAEILTRFMFTKNMDEVMKVWDEIYEEYGLCDDPFTNIPCTPKEYYNSKLEYERQLMIERYGHCDGLE